MTNTVIKIDWYKDVYFDETECNEKFKDTNKPLNGKYQDAEGDIYYYKNGKLHNENGPTIIRKDFTKVYCINGKTHRIDGPARIYSDGVYVWYINDNYINDKTMDNWLTENDIPLDWTKWTDSDKKKFANYWTEKYGDPLAGFKQEQSESKHIGVFVKTKSGDLVITGNVLCDVVKEMEKLKDIISIKSINVINT